MYLSQLTLSNFRSWRELEAEFMPGITLISGVNAAGKSNLLEAIYLLASLRSTRAQTEGELISWSAPPPQVSRVAGNAVTAADSVSVAVAIAARSEGGGSAARQRSGAPLTSKRIQVNGVARRAADALGAIRAVQFTTLDIELLTGPAALRRRFLDVAVGQLQPSHAASISRYQRALAQRNALLKQVGQRQAAASELDQWDPLVATAAEPIWRARAAAAAAISDFACQRHRALRSPDDPAETLSLSFAPADSTTLLASRSRDIARGSTSVGPHRDELMIDLDGRPAANFASRAQQRAVALSLRLAEADFLEAESGDSPILLLDDVFSELDPGRRERTADAVRSHSQQLLTSADPETVPIARSELSAAYQILDGRLQRL